MASKREAPRVEKCTSERGGETTDEAPGEDTCPEVGAPPENLYRALTRGSEAEKAAAALAVLEDRENHARTILSRAIGAIVKAPNCKHLRALTETLRDCHMDYTTRAGAALALGAIARSTPCLFPSGGGVCQKPHAPIPRWSEQVLRRCTSRYPMMVARACVEALGHVSADQITLLTQIRDADGGDSLKRLLAGRALTRLTNTPQVTNGSLDQVMRDSQRMVTK